MMIEHKLHHSVLLMPFAFSLTARLFGLRYCVAFKTMDFHCLERNTNQFPCDGYTLSALASLRLKSAAPSNPVSYRSAFLVQMEGSVDLKSTTLAKHYDSQVCYF